VKAQRNINRRDKSSSLSTGYFRRSPGLACKLNAYTLGSHHTLHFGYA